MHGILFNIFYNTKLTKDMLSVFIHADNGVDACVKAMQMLSQDDIEVMGIEKII